MAGEEGWIDVPAESVSRETDTGWIDAPEAAPPTQAPRVAMFGIPIPNLNDPADRAMLSKTWEAFSHGAAEGMGPENLGFSDKSVAWFIKNGFYREHPGIDSAADVGRAMFEGVTYPAAAMLDAAWRLPNTAYHAIGDVALLHGVPRDIVAMPEAFMGSPRPLGIPESPVRAGAPERIPEAPSPPSGAVYHGTNRVFLDFDPRELQSASGSRDAAHGFYFAQDPEIASFFADNPKTGRIIEAQLDIKNPKIIELDPGSGLDKTESVREAFAAGHDAVIFKGSSEGKGPVSTTYVVPNVEQIQQQRSMTLAEARDLGVIGPEPPRLADAPPAEAVKNVVPRTMAAKQAEDVIRGPEPGGENPWRERFDKFVSKIEKPADVQQLIRDGAKDEMMPARQGEIPLRHVEALEEAAGVEPGSTDPRGLGRLMRNDAEVRIGMQTMLQAAENVKTAARDLKAADTPENMIKFQEAMMRRDIAVEQIVGLRAEWGRTGNVFQEFLRDVKDQEGLSAFLKEKGKGRTPEDLRDLARGIDELDATQAAKVLTEMRRTPPSPLYWTWVQGLISGLLTHTKYVAANAVYLGTERGVTTPIAALIGKAKQLAGVEADRVFFGESMAATYGIVSAVPHAFIATAKSVRSGQRAVLQSEIELHRLAVERGEKVPPTIDRAVNQISGMGRPEGKLLGIIPTSADTIWGRILGAPGDAAMGIHSFFKILGERASLDARAYSKAIEEGLHPTAGEFWPRFNELRANPTEDMRVGAVADAYKGTFMQELGPKGRDWQRLTKGNPFLKWVFPFSHIPINLVKATYEHTPFAFLDAEMNANIMGKNGGVAQDKAIARMIAGSALMGYFTNLGMTGQATGDFPTDPKERDSWNLQGKQPNSVLIDGYWVSFAKFGPAGNLANVGANIAHVVHTLQKEDEDAMTQATWHAAEAAARVVIDEAGFLSLAMLFEAIHDPKKGAQWAANTAGTFVPFSSFLRQTASGGVPLVGGGDPYMRKVQTFLDGVKYNIPGVRETLLPKRDWLGTPIANPQYHNILRQRAAVTDPVHLEMERLQIHPGPPQDRIGGVKLTPELFDEYSATVGPYTKMQLDALVNMPGWYDQPDYIRETAIRETIKGTRAAGAAVMQMAHPELIEQGVQQRIDHISGKTHTARPKKAPTLAAP